jgi:hypothetical protein
MTYDRDAALAGIRELCAQILRPPRKGEPQRDLWDRDILARRLAVAVVTQDDAMTTGERPPGPWLTGQATPFNEVVRTTCGHRHAEAYRLMTYTTDDGTGSEQIWNSRDGVTPFVTHLRDGRTATHRSAPGDRYDPGHVPQPGERVFADMTRAYAERAAAYQVERYSDDPAWAARLAELGSRGQAIRYLATQFTTQPGSPVLLTVGDDWTWDLVLPPG